MFLTDCAVLPLSVVQCVHSSSGQVLSRVREDIVQSMNLQDAYTAISSFDRPNLFYGVSGLNRTATFKQELAREILKDVGKSGSTIIYCTTIKDVEEVNQKLILQSFIYSSYLHRTYPSSR